MGEEHELGSAHDEHHRAGGAAGRARKELTERGVDALLLGPSADLYYLTGYQAPRWNA